MGWWEQGGDVLGDGPVDRIERTLEIFSAGTEKPELQYFVDSVAAALQSDAALLLVEPDAYRAKRLRLKLEPPSADVVSGDEPADISLREHLAGTFFDISDEYEGGVGRKPRLREILGTIAFALGVRPERFLAVEEGLSVTEITAEPLEP